MLIQHSLNTSMAIHLVCPLCHAPFKQKLKQIENFKNKIIGNEIIKKSDFLDGIKSKNYFETTIKCDCGFIIKYTYNFKDNIKEIINERV